MARKDLKKGFLQKKVHTKQPRRVIGSVVGYAEHRDILSVKDALGNTVDLIPTSATVASIQVELFHPLSGESLSFWLTLPKEVAEFYHSSRIKVARTVGALAQEMSNTLRGIKDDHDRAVDAAEAEVKETKPKKARPKTKIKTRGVGSRNK